MSKDKALRDAKGIAEFQTSAKAASEAVDAWQQERDECDAAALENAQAHTAWLRQRAEIDKRYADSEDTRHALVEREVSALERIAAALEARNTLPWNVFLSSPFAPPFVTGDLSIECAHEYPTHYAGPEPARCMKCGR